MMNDFTLSEKLKITNAKETLVLALKKRFYELELPYSTRDMFLSGGAIASILQEQMPNDFDIYFKDAEISLSISKYFNANTSQVKDISEKYREYAGTDGKTITENAITLKNGIQFITKHTGTPEKIRETFDFIHCRPYLDFDSKMLYISKSQYDACVNKMLVVNNPKAVTQHRLEKFLKKGYRQL